MLLKAWFMRFVDIFYKLIFTVQNIMSTWQVGVWGRKHKSETAISDYHRLAGLVD